jgi:hypothetical protein
VRPIIDAQKSLQSKAADLIASIQDLRPGDETTDRQLGDLAIPLNPGVVDGTAVLWLWPARSPHTAAVFTLAIGALSVASAIFLLLELDAPYSGMLRLPPAPMLQAIDALGK